MLCVNRGRIHLGNRLGSVCRVPEEDLFPSFIMWVLGIELSLSGLVAGSLPTEPSM